MFSFHVMGFRVDVKQGFLVRCAIYALLYLQARTPIWVIAMWLAMVFVSITLHELGHALASRRLKVPVYEVFLWQLGGMVRHASTTPKNSLLISLAGPGIELLVGLPALVVLWTVDLPYGPLYVFLRFWAYVNVFWALINLVPMFPLDGGNALSSYLTWRHMGPSRARRTVGQVGVLSGTVIALGGYAYDGGMFWLLFGAYLAYWNYQIWQQSSR